MEKITEKQLKKFATVFKRSGKTFQVLAGLAGLKNIPDHASELSNNEARQFLKHHGMYLTTRKEKS